PSFRFVDVSVIRDLQVVSIRPRGGCWSNKSQGTAKSPAGSPRYFYTSSVYSSKFKPVLFLNNPCIDLCFCCSHQCTGTVLVIIFPGIDVSWNSNCLNLIAKPYVLDLWEIDI